MYIARKTYLTVNKFFDGITESQLDNFNILKDNVVIVSGNTIKLTLKQLFGNFEIIHSDSIEEVIGYWNNFKTVYRQSFTRMYEALTADYSPVENYSKISTVNTQGTATSSTNSNIINKETTEDSATFHDTSFSDSDNTSNANSNTVVTENTHGNIGVKSNMDFITEEIRGRKEMALAKIVCELYAEMELI